MESFRKAAEVTGRVIPENAIAQEGAGGTVYLYATPYVTKKGREGVNLYAKAFRPGQRKHAWHHVFTTEAERAAKVAEFLANVSEVVS